MSRHVDLVEVDHVVGVGNGRGHVVVGGIEGGTVVAGIAKVEDGIFVSVEDGVIFA